MIEGILHRVARRSAGVLACGVAVLGVAACGSSSKKSTTTTTAPAVSSTPTSTTSSTPTATGTSSTPTGTSTSATATSTTGGAAVSPSSYMTAAKALAKQFETASVKFTNELNGGGVSQSALVPLTQQYASALTAFASGLSKLTPPANLANDQATVINGVKGLIPIILKLGRDGAAGNKAATQADAQAIQSALLKLKGPGKKLGLK